ncbi:MAG: hypothetical protein AAGH82_08465 [Pseudomonadota bacterium]
MARFVGIGFGAIQAGLFVREAHRSGAFDSISIAARRGDLVDGIKAKQSFKLNVAHADRVVTETISDVEAYRLAQTDRDALIDALTAATEIAVAVSSVADYAGGGPDGPDQLLAQAVLRKARGEGPKAIIYAAENHHDAARLLAQAVVAAASHIDPSVDVSVAFQTVDTVIGKMSRVVDDPDELTTFGLGEMTPGSGRAFLVEAFNHIQISRIDPALTSGRHIAVFDEKDNLRPFEDAKLHGHNATHALLAYLGMLAGHKWIVDVLADERIAPLARQAFVAESGAALCAQHDGQDPLFTAAGYADYVDDLIARMGSPFLRDTCQRIGRDVERKLGWNDRLAGTMRICLQHGVAVPLYALATLAALQTWQGQTRDLTPLEGLWTVGGAGAQELQAVLTAVAAQRSKFQNLLADISTDSAA